jgi:hypothetical protein
MALNPVLSETRWPVPREGNERKKQIVLDLPDLVVYREAMVCFRLCAESLAPPLDLELLRPPEFFGVGNCYLTLQRLVFVWTPPPTSTLLAFEVPLSALYGVRAHSPGFWASTGRLECLVKPFIGSALWPYRGRLVIEAQSCTGLDELSFILERALSMHNAVSESYMDDHVGIQPQVRQPRAVPASVSEQHWVTSRQKDQALDASFSDITRSPFPECARSAFKQAPQRPIAYTDDRHQPPRVYLVGSPEVMDENGSR